MRVLYTLFGAALIACGVFVAALVKAERPVEPVSAPVPVQMGDSTAPSGELDALGLRVLTSLRAMTFVEIYDCFVNYRQSAELLARDEENYRLTEHDLTWEEIRGGIDGKRGTDPLGKLKLTNVKDYQALDIRAWFALQCGCWRIHRNDAKDLEEHMKASWYAVDRQTGLRASKKDAYGHLQPSGTIMYRNHFGDNLRVICISANNKWHLEDFVFQVGRVRGGSIPIDSSEVADPRVVNARNTLKLIFDKMRATFQANKDSLPATLTFEAIGIKSGELDAKYFNYGIKLDGNKSDGFKGTQVFATPKKGLKLPEVILTVDTLKNDKSYAIRDTGDE